MKLFFAIAGACVLAWVFCNFIDFGRALQRSTYCEQTEGARQAEAEALALHAKEGIARAEFMQGERRKFEAQVQAEKDAHYAVMNEIARLRAQDESDKKKSK